MIVAEQIVPGLRVRPWGRDRIYTLTKMPAGWCLVDASTWEAFGVISGISVATIRQAQITAADFLNNGYEAVE